MELSDFFEENKHVAIAFSGGVDSAYLLYMAVKCGADVTAYYVKSAFQPEFEYQDAIKLADELGVKMSTIKLDVLQCAEVVANPSNRCYFCKQQIFGVILKQAKDDGYTFVVDGTNASDDANDRPGMKALQELSVRSPLRECGLTKDEIRIQSREAGLFTWDKPAYACLATRIRTGEQITAQKLMITEKAEQYLFDLGFTDFRIRMVQEKAKLQLIEKDMPLYEQHKQQITERLLQDYSEVTVENRYS